MLLERIRQNFIFLNIKSLNFSGLAMWIREAPLSIRAINALTGAGIETVEQCLKLKEDAFFNIPNIGEKTVNEIVTYMQKFWKSNSTPKTEDPILEDPKKRFDYLASVLSISLQDIIFSERAKNVSEKMGMKLLRDLVVVSPQEFFEEKNSGKKTLSEVINLLHKLDLKLGMNLPLRLKKEIKRRIKIFRNPASAIKRFKKKYPEKADIFEELKVTVLSKNKVDFYTRCFDLYKEGGTLEYAGEKTGLTRERVRQILVKGTKYKLFQYTPRNYVYVPKEKLIKDILKFRNLGKVARKNKVSLSYLKRMLISYRITKNKIDELVLAGQKEILKNEYLKIKEQLGHHPTTTELQSNGEWRALEARMRRMWKSIHEFRNELDIPAPPSFAEAVRPWLEHRMRIAHIKRMQDLDNIREILLVAGPLQTSEIAMQAKINYARAFKLTQLLIATGEVIKEGIGSATHYKISNDREINNEDYYKNTPSN